MISIGVESKDITAAEEDPLGAVLYSREFWVKLYARVGIHHRMMVRRLPFERAFPGWKFELDSRASTRTLITRKTLTERRGIASSPIAFRYQW